MQVWIVMEQGSGCGCHDPGPDSVAEIFTSEEAAKKNVDDFNARYTYTSRYVSWSSPHEVTT